MKKRNWHHPPEKLTLLNNEIHLWRADLDLSKVLIKKLAHSLSEDEITRAHRFRFQEHCDRFIAGRGILRQLLANYLQIPSDRVVFEYSDRGKPHLASSLNLNNLQFNISHSQNLALYAFTNQRIIGADLEYIKDNVDHCQLAKRFFTNQELQLINNSKAEKQKTIFFQLWTAKEAFLKATGDGLAGLALDAVEFTLNQNGNLSLVTIKKTHHTRPHWLIDNFIPQDNFVATIAVKNNLNISNSIATKFFEFHLSS
ncbi:phosphopantetheine--protein transferase [Xenococcus sp. PCC 7305]|uniref:4'-phosphopantetheinyl transferase family protein n=1 Tax=Xenococcus sp. PCC 7305 TaxID=102125 RepID=UPI0002ACEB8E|nr:4'-phosphopantetheinyl transferase superfamily protein [Xenococcus sp. PCC 7305]ELS01320.1 phosphopantetheine--protein transferase [Xenococcus sp. PCC 7305]